jgi:hypothetical protein
MEQFEINEVDVFWGELAPCEHLVQLYDGNDVFLDALAGFAAGGLRGEDAVVVIATSEHLNALEERLQKEGLDLISARAEDRYIPLDASETLAEFMVNGWPDDALFAATVGRILKRARGRGRQVRAFGEMVAIMWHNGFQGGTVRLEHLWHQLCQQEGFSLFCAYPRSGFTETTQIGVKQICDAHSKVIRGTRSARSMMVA